MEKATRHMDWYIGFNDAVIGRQARWQYLSNPIYQEGYKAAIMKGRLRQRSFGWPFC